MNSFIKKILKSIVQLFQKPSYWVLSNKGQGSSYLTISKSKSPPNLSTFFRSSRILAKFKTYQQAQDYIEEIERK